MKWVVIVQGSVLVAMRMARMGRQALVQGVEEKCSQRVSYHRGSSCGYNLHGINVTLTASQSPPAPRPPDPVPRTWEYSARTSPPPRGSKTARPKSAGP